MGAEVAPEADAPVWNLGIYGNLPQGGERGIMQMYEYSPEGKQMPDVTVACASKKLLVEAIPADWTPESGEEAQRQPVWQITFANPTGPDYGGNTDFETIGTAIDRGDAVKFRFDVGGAKAFSVCREQPGSFDICAKVYPLGEASTQLHYMQVGDTIDCYVHRKSTRVSRERYELSCHFCAHFWLTIAHFLEDFRTHLRPSHLALFRRGGSHVALVAYGVGITECLPMAAAELAQPEPEHVRLLWASRSRGDCAFWRDQLEALGNMYPERFSFVEIFCEKQQQQPKLPHVSSSSSLPKPDPFLH